MVLSCTNYNTVLRDDTLTISKRSYSDSDKAVTCKYSFSDPTSTLTATTNLIYRGKGTDNELQEYGMD